MWTSGRNHCARSPRRCPATRVNSPSGTGTWRHHAWSASELAAGSGGFGPDGTVLITGGTGALGAEVARHLVTSYGVRHLLITGRQGPQAPNAEQLRVALQELGAEVRIVACDVADRVALTELIKGCSPALTAVVHAAGYWTTVSSPG